MVTPGQEEDIGLDKKLESLGWTMWAFTRAYTIAGGEEPTENNIRRNYTTIRRAIKNPDAISLGLYKSIIAVIGGKLHHTWSEIPEEDIN